MEDYERSRIVALLDKDPELRSLWQEHEELGRQIEKLETSSHQTPTETIARKQLQKQKLAGKDRIAEILARYPEG